MPAISFTMGAFAVYIAWTLVRALRNGVIFSDGVPYNARERPVMFVSMAAVHCGGALLFAGLAAGGGTSGVWQLIGSH
jgi:hypothetical protein